MSEARVKFVVEEFMFLRKKNKAGLDVLLTTYPEQGSKNVGDNLITASAIKLVRYRVPGYNPFLLFREEPLERFAAEELRTILAPGFSVNDESYPKLFRLYEDPEKIPKEFYPVGCTFQHLVPLKETYEQYKYSKKTLAFLSSVVKGSGPIPCRDQLIVDMLGRNSIPAFYCGDLALYDDNTVGKPFIPPAVIGSVAFTVQHKPKFINQSFLLLDLIKAEFPKAKLYVVHHSQINKNSQRVADYAKSIGFIERDLCGDVSNLDFYNQIDLHVGYRLHGHISFLRRRKPSFLLVEDTRSFGVANTGDLEIGCFSAHDCTGKLVDDDAPNKLFDYVRTQKANGFIDYFKLFGFIDRTYHVSVRPFFDLFSKKLGWRESVFSRLLRLVRV